MVRITFFVVAAFFIVIVSNAVNASGNEKNSISSQELKEAFQRIYKIEGAPDDARLNLDLVVKSLRQDEPLSVGVDSFIRILLLEGKASTSDARSNYRTINDSLRTGESRLRATDSFLALLLADGVTASADARSNYQLIDRFLDHGDRQEETALFVRLLKEAEYTTEAQEQYKRIKLGY